MLCIRPNQSRISLQPHGAVEQLGLVDHPFAELIGDMPRHPLGTFSIVRNAAPDADSIECPLEHVKFVGAEWLVGNLPDRNRLVAVRKRVSVQGKKWPRWGGAKKREILFQRALVHLIT